MLIDNFKACIQESVVDTTCARCMEFFGRTTVIPQGTLCDITWPDGVACVKCSAFCEAENAVSPMNVYRILGISELFREGRKEDAIDMLGALAPETFQAASLSMHGVAADLFVFLCAQVGTKTTAEEFDNFDGTNPDIIRAPTGARTVESLNRPE